ncbi:MAG TPA: hypothetical protein VKY57_14900 [Chitinispirillaceae bacterium]|nr:hypothetical protein [Chitinispirillaceae bacterium]
MNNIDRFTTKQGDYLLWSIILTGKIRQHFQGRSGGNGWKKRSLQ